MKKSNAFFILLLLFYALYRAGIWFVEQDNLIKQAAWDPENKLFDHDGAYRIGTAHDTNCIIPVSSPAFQEALNWVFSPAHPTQIPYPTQIPIKVTHGTACATAVGDKISMFELFNIESDNPGVNIHTQNINNIPSYYFSVASPGGALSLQNDEGKHTNLDWKYTDPSDFNTGVITPIHSGPDIGTCLNYEDKILSMTKNKKCKTGEGNTRWYPKNFHKLTPSS